jgi:hypothetical protein
MLKKVHRIRADAREFRSLAFARIPVALQSYDFPNRAPRSRLSQTQESDRTDRLTLTIHSHRPAD